MSNYCRGRRKQSLKGALTVMYTMPGNSRTSIIGGEVAVTENDDRLFDLSSRRRRLFYATEQGSQECQKADKHADPAGQRPIHLSDKSVVIEIHIQQSTEISI